MVPSISAQDVRVQIDGAEILHGITTAIPAGSITGLLGPSGAGKTTLMRVMVGRQRLKGGTMSVLGQPAGAAGLRGRIGYMTQAPSVYPDLTVGENLRYFAAMLGLGRGVTQGVVQQVDLGEQADQLARTLSGGQLSRLSLAIALLGKPELLVLDEPTVGVDPVLRVQLWHLFRELSSEGRTLIVSSHVMDEASRCDNLILIRHGAILAYGAPETLRKQVGAATIEETFLKLVDGQA
ncbi:MAG TPA: ABC transporter ATP-binding protein [Candidatus Saccharimonadales bacterium]|nr:ABC transporter ATP-binding protein [Candidatus Saccharimonadales bacterium]